MVLGVLVCTVVFNTVGLELDYVEGLRRGDSGGVVLNPENLVSVFDIGVESLIEVKGYLISH